MRSFNDYIDLYCYYHKAFSIVAFVTLFRRFVDEEKIIINYYITFSYANSIENSI